MRYLLSIWIWLCYVVLFLLFFVLVFLTWLLTLPFDPYNRIPNKVLALLGRAMLAVNPLWSVSISGTEKYDRDHPTIFVSNHQGFLDMPLLYHLPWTMKWVSKKSLLYIPVLGWIIKFTGHLSLDRSSRDAMQRLGNLVQPLRDRIPVMIFPEGTRTISGDLKPFKNGAFLLAHEYGFRIQPMVIDGSYEALRSGSWSFKPRVDFTVELLDPVNPSGYSSMSDLKRAVQEQIATRYNELKTEIT